MKNLFLCLVLLLSGAIAQAQIIELEEAKVDYFPNLKSGNDGSYSYVVKEKFSGEFTSDAIGFMKANFDIHAFMNKIGEEIGAEGYLVTFRNGQGFLEADFDKKGELRGTHQQFRDILVPDQIRKDLYRNHQGWTMVKNKYVASGRGDILDKEMYRVKLQKGNEVRTVKINPRAPGNSGVASK